jgi:hypothetical protein
VVGILEGGGAAIEGRVVEIPPRGGQPPDELCELAAVLGVSDTPFLGGEVILVPIETPRRGFAGAMTATPSACRRSITPFQLDPSANAP